MIGLPQGMAKPKILIVDDDPILLELLDTIIQNKMFLDCDLAASGKVALQALEKNRYDLVITDARMPEMTGLELLAQAKAQYPKLDIIVMTAFTDEFSFLEVIRAGASDYLPKPLSIHEVEAKISRVLRERAVLQDLLERNVKLQEDTQKWSEDAALLEAAPNRHKALLESSRDLLFVLEPDGRVRECNGEVSKTLGLTPGQSLLDCVATDDAATVRADLGRAEKGEPVSFRTKLLGKDGARVYEISLMPLEGKRRKAVVHVVARDASRRMELEKRFYEEHDRINTLCNSKPDALLIIERDFNISYMNGPARDILEDLGVHEGDRYHSGMFKERRQSGTCIVQRAFELKEPFSMTATGTNRYGEIIFWEERTIPILEGGEVARVMHILRDITELREVEVELRLLSVKDTLTDLYNRRHFCEVLEREMHRAQRQRSALCLVLMDVDGFKEFNDQHGHVAGDEVLILLGEMIKDCIREHVDSACRLGGDEFTIVLPQTAVEQATQVAQRLREKFLPFKQKGLSLSIGVAPYNDESRVQDFIDKADKAMYEVKHSGKDAIRVV